MTIQRKFSLLTLASALLVTAAGASGVLMLLDLHAWLTTGSTVAASVVRVDEWIARLASVSALATAAILCMGVIAARSVARRLAAFRAGAPGALTEPIVASAGDEVDVAAARI